MEPVPPLLPQEESGVPPSRRRLPLLKARPLLESRETEEGGGLAKKDLTEPQTPLATPGRTFLRMRLETDAFLPQFANRRLGNEEEELREASMEQNPLTEEGERDSHPPPFDPPELLDPEEEEADLLECFRFSFLEEEFLR